MKISLIILLILAILLLSIGIDKPFIGHHDFNSVVYSHLARNYLRKGFLQLGATHYPPFLQIFLGASFAIFGVTEWAARLVPLITSLGMIVFLFKLTEELWNQRVAILASIFLIFTPMFLYFGKMPVHEIVSPMFILLSLYYYHRWLKKGTMRNYFVVVLGIILGELTSWTAYYLPPLLIVHAYFFKKKSWRRIFILLPLSFLMFGLHLLRVKLSTGSFVSSDLLQIFLFRLNLGSEAANYGFTYQEFLIGQARWLVVYFTRVVVILSFFWLLKTLYLFLKKKKIVLRDSFVLILLVFGFSHNLIFRNAAFIHDYLLYYALPFFSLSASLMLYQLGKRIKNNRLILILYVLVFYFFVTERIPFIKALLNTEMNKPGYKLGLLLNQLTSEEEKGLVNSRDFGSFFDVFVRFYAERGVFSLCQHAHKKQYSFSLKPIFTNQFFVFFLWLKFL